MRPAMASRPMFLLLWSVITLTCLSVLAFQRSLTPSSVPASDRYSTPPKAATASAITESCFVLGDILASALVMLNTISLPHQLYSRGMSGLRTSSSGTSS